MDCAKLRKTSLKIRVMDGSPYAAVEDLISSMRNHAELMAASPSRGMSAVDYINQFTTALDENVTSVVKGKASNPDVPRN